ncbi:Hypothetical Protein FCC1311_043062 [Hondaea fermentalgiana]|uniref:Uncharacterized protein n=1 Tax=Hondaea fermentalgiana TaxID=2315210 RepID=A0A2R5GHG4_9STRA|nr:Hypothetical Protein FCC1311_043062 [Hondaea fermentalgiana]|eukprot:GBG28083.1 Hypothetical Protein FCC1311_043062 [Hondaea fermentalgiana]
MNALMPNRATTGSVSENDLIRRGFLPGPNQFQDNDTSNSAVVAAAAAASAAAAAAAAASAQYRHQSHAFQIQHQNPLQDANQSAQPSDTSEDDLLSALDRAWFENAEPEISAMAEALGQEDANGLLPLKDAAWFLESLETYHMGRVTAAERAAIVDSNLRTKVKHRAAILFHEDVDFIIHYPKRFMLDANDPFCERDPQRWIIHELSKILVNNYQVSIRAKANRSCIWSALMSRALFHLERSGFNQVRISNNTQANNEATLFVGDYHISRSNLTKLLKRHAGAQDGPDGADS